MPGSRGVRMRPLLFSCSGASDVGHIADSAARRLDSMGAAQLGCLAGIGGRVLSHLAAARRAPELMAIDGCECNCARRTLEEAGLTCAIHVRVTDNGIAKGAAQDREAGIRRVLQDCLTLLENRAAE